nr:hypothetical protein [Tanacetum cinerariifolium]
MRFERYASWDFRHRHIGCWRDGVGSDWVHWGVRKRAEEDGAIVTIFGGKNGLRLLYTGVGFWEFTQLALEVNLERKMIYDLTYINARVDGKKIIISETSIRRDLLLADKEGVDCLPNSTIFEQLTLMGKPTRKVIQVPQPSDPIEYVADKAVHKELGDSLVRASTTASSLEAEQDSGNINKTQSKATPNESSSQRNDSGGGLWCQEAIGDTTAQTRFESVSKHSNDSLLVRGNTLQSDEDRMKFNELMALCTS